MNTKKEKGYIAEMAVASYLIEMGWKVLLPVGESHRYDLATEKNGKFIRIQVKYVTPKKGSLQVRFASSNNWSVLKYTPEQIDVVAVYNSGDKNIYFVPASMMNNSTLNLRIEPTRNNQKQKIRYASEFAHLNL